MNKQLSICLLNDSFPPSIDGVANTVLNYAKVINNSLGDAIVAAPNYPGLQENYPFPVLRYPSVKTPRTEGYRVGLPIRSVVKEISKYPIDIIHCHCPFVSAMLSKQLRNSTGAPVIMTYHTKFDIDVAHNFDSKVVKAAAKKLIVSNIEACDEVWAVSRGAGENLRSLGFSGRYRIMENGVDFPKGPAPEMAILRAGAELSLPDDTPVFLYVGRMMWYKGIRIILDGLHKIKGYGVRFKMVFVGGGDDYSDIISHTRRLGLSGDCIFTGPVTDRERLRAYFSRADLFLFPSTYDTSGIVVREAAACGLASVLIRGSSAAEPIRDGKNGVLIEENPNSLARALIRITKNKELTRRLGQRAMDELYISWDDAIANAYQHYFDVLAKRQKATL